MRTTNLLLISFFLVFAGCGRINAATEYQRRVQIDGVDCVIATASNSIAMDCNWTNVNPK